MDNSEALLDQVQSALDAKAPLRIEGGGSKGFLNPACEGTPLSTGGHQGVVSYDPTELVITARAGTTIRELNRVLGEQHQMLAFEPAEFHGHATLGGTVACNLAGPRRPFTGGVRDFILGVKLINGLGQALDFGGQVMKNVAGYDVAKLVAGSQGTLGIILEVSLKVLPLPKKEITLRFELSQQKAIDALTQWQRRPLPLAGACHLNDELWVRLAGSASAVDAAHKQMGGVETQEPFWKQLKEWQGSFFALQPGEYLWRIHLPPAYPSLSLPGQCLLDWGGALRWYKVSEDPASWLKQLPVEAGLAMAAGAQPPERLYQPPLPEPQRQLHKRIKTAFDPAGIFNPGRIF